MRIGGLQRFSLIDFPGTICATIFTRGCNFRCPYCHNPELVDPALFGTCIPESDVYSFLARRRGKLDAVTITGGEPLLQKDVADVVLRLHESGFRVKIDTNGSFPDVLSALIRRGLIDYLSMDVKAPLHRYGEVTGNSSCSNAVTESIRLIMDSPIDYEFRTTIVRELLTIDDIAEIGEMLRGARRYVLQRFIPTKLLDPAYLGKKTFSDEEFGIARQRLEPMVRTVLIR